MSDTSNLIIGDNSINSRDVLRCEIGEFNGRKTIVLRKWFRASDGSLKPTPKGLTISLVHLPWIVMTITAALARARADHLLPAEGSDHE